MPCVRTAARTQSPSRQLTPVDTDQLPADPVALIAAQENYHAADCSRCASTLQRYVGMDDAVPLLRRKVIEARGHDDARTNGVDTDVVLTHHVADVETPIQIDVDDAIPDRRVDFHDRNSVVASCGRGVVDHEIQPPELLHHLVRQRLYRPEVSHIADYRERASAHRPHFLGHRIDISPTGCSFISRK